MVAVRRRCARIYLCWRWLTSDDLRSISEPSPPCGQHAYGCPARRSCFTFPRLSQRSYVGSLKQLEKILACALEYFVHARCSQQAIVAFRTLSPARASTAARHDLQQGWHGSAHTIPALDVRALDTTDAKIVQTCASVSTTLTAIRLAYGRGRLEGYAVQVGVRLLPPVVTAAICRRNIMAERHLHRNERVLVRIYGFHARTRV